MVVKIKFSECEHSGDLEAYAAAVHRLCGHVIETELDYKAETGTVTVDVPDEQAFIAAFAAARDEVDDLAFGRIVH